MHGFTDKPVSGKAEDIFGVDKYIKGLSSFIQDCATPMTVAVQGDWGSGKTSFMMLIREEIEHHVLPIWFNTWQFSQFDLGEHLPVMLISKLSAALDVKGSKGEALKGSLQTLANTALKLGLSLVDMASGMNVSGAVEEARGGESSDVTAVIAKLKTQFQACVKEALQVRGKDRVVIFVDDLDRLQPARAVELLEVLKLFLDCDDCVFLLAIDYNVVSQGIRQKYGETINDDKGRSFFDKIIQVPFKMPVAHYDIAKYVKSALEQMELSVEDAGPYVELIKASIGYNPRGMKRLLNAFLLLQRIHSGECLDQAYEKQLLFAVLCLQLSYEEIYNFVVRNCDRLTPEFFDDLANPESYAVYLGQPDMEDIANPQDSLDPTLIELFDTWGVDAQTDTGKATGFLLSFCNTLADQNGKLTVKHIAGLRDILNFSATTASESVAVKGAPISANGIVGKGVRYTNVLDETAQWHAIDETITFDSVKKLPGWNGSILSAFSLFGQEKDCQKFGKMLCEVLGTLYQKNPEKFLSVRENAAQYKLSVLFNGVGSGIQASALIPGTDICIETKTMSHQKVMDLKKLMVAMGYAPSELKLMVRLAHRATAPES